MGLLKLLSVERRKQKLINGVVVVRSITRAGIGPSGYQYREVTRVLVRAPTPKDERDLCMANIYTPLRR